MKKSKKIGIVLFSLAGGGTEKNMLFTTRYLLNHGLETEIFSLTSQNDYLSESASLAKNNRLHFISKQMIPRSIPLLINNWIFILISFYKQIKRRNISLLVATDTFTSWLAYFFFVTTGTPYVVICNISPLHSRTAGLLNIVFHKCKMIVCVSRGLSDEIHKVYKIPLNRIMTIYNGILPVKTEYPLSGKKVLDIIDGLRPRNTILLAVGRLEKQKNPYLVVKSFAQLRKTALNTILIILGKGSLETELVKQIKKHCLEKCVILPGFVQNPRIFMEKADIFISGSSYEGFGNTLIEAMDAGLPVISTDCRFGPREILDGNARYITNKDVLFAKYGTLVPPGEINATAEKLALAVNTLIENRKKKEYYRNLSIKRAKFFSGNKMLRSYHKLFSNLIK